MEEPMTQATSDELQSNREMVTETHVQQHTTGLHTLLERTKAYKTLNGYLNGKQAAGLLQQNNVRTTTIADANELRTLAAASLLRYSDTQAYCCVSTVDDALNDKRLAVAHAAARSMPSVRAFKLTAVEDAPDAASQALELSKEPMYLCHKQRRMRTAWEQVVDNAMTETLGSENMEFTKNTTVDLIEPTNCADRVAHNTNNNDDHQRIDSNIDKSPWNLNIWRDRLGFVISDRYDFVELTVTEMDVLRRAAESMTHDDANAAKYVMRQAPEHFRAIDQRVSGIARAPFIRFLLDLPNARDRVAFAVDGVHDSQLSCGVSLLIDDTLAMLYANSDAAMRALFLDATLANPSADRLVVTVERNGALHRLLHELDLNIVERRVRRLHTTMPPRSIRWENVYAFNCGVHVV